MALSLYQPTQDKQVANHIYRTSVSGLYYVAHHKHGDARGFFSEIGLIPDIEEVIGHSFTIKQLNLSRSQTNVVRGIHRENWNKFVTVTQGSCFCAVADVNPQSPTYKQVATFMLGDGDTDLPGSLYISAGLGNSACIVRGPVDYLYVVDALYRDRNPQFDQAISLFDPSLHIDWPIDRNQMILSDRDQRGINLDQI